MRLPDRWSHFWLKIFDDVTGKQGSFVLYYYLSLIETKDRMCWGQKGQVRPDNIWRWRRWTVTNTHRNGEEYDRDRIMDFSDLFTFSSAHSNCGCSSVSSIRRCGSDRGWWGIRGRIGIQPVWMKIVAIYYYVHDPACIYGRILCCKEEIKKTVDKPCVPSYDKNSKKTKVVRKNSTHKLFAEREVHRLKDIPEKDMWKVAFEPSRRTCLLQISGRTCKLIMRRKFSYIARSSQK